MNSIKVRYLLASHRSGAGGAFPAVSGVTDDGQWKTVPVHPGEGVHVAVLVPDGDGLFVPRVYTMLRGNLERADGGAHAPQAGDVIVNLCSEREIPFQAGMIGVVAVDGTLAGPAMAPLMAMFETLAGNFLAETAGKINAALHAAYQGDGVTVPDAPAS